MRRLISFTCEGCMLAATVDEASGQSGLLIVSGGNEIRSGAHRGMAMLAQDIAEKGYPVFRFDRRGIGDSDGVNEEFTSSEPDISAAVAAFRAAQPHVQRIVAFGNCDGASALLLHDLPGINALVLGNVWVIEPAGDGGDSLPNSAAIKARYLEKLKDPKALLGLFTGAVDLRKLMGGLLKLLKPKAPVTSDSLHHRVAAGLARFPGPVTLLIAARDGVALAFLENWKSGAFAQAKARADVQVQMLDSDSHSFAPATDKAVLIAALERALGN